MPEDRPIKVHCNEEMRAHLEFVLRRHDSEIRDFMRRGKNVAQWEAELTINRKCILEVSEAGT